VDYFTVRNTVIVALAQVGIIVVGTLAAGAVIKWYGLGFAGLPVSTVFVAEYGFLILGLPVAWAAIALYLLRHNPDDDGVRWGTFGSGVLVVLLLLVGVWHTAAWPFLRPFFASTTGLSL